MSLLFSVFALLFANDQARFFPTSDANQVESLFQNYINDFSKSYEPYSNEYFQRLQIFNVSQDSLNTMYNFFVY